MNQCSTCIHWRQIGAKASARLEGTIGECRQAPPKTNFNWPRTKAIDSCGQWSGSSAHFAEAAPQPKPETRAQLTLDAGTSGGAPLQPSGSGNRQKRASRAQA